MALPATDAFTGTNGTALTTYSANWTMQTGVMQINTNAVAPNSSSARSSARWNADTFNNNQYSFITVAAIGSAVYVGPSVRLSNTDGSGYYIEANNNELFLYKRVGSTETQLGSTSPAVAVNDVLRLEANGTTITPLKNGSTTGTPGAQTDSSISSGWAGMEGYSSGTTSRMDTWEGGNLGGAGVVGPLLRGRLVKRGILQGRLVNA